MYLLQKGRAGGGGGGGGGGGAGGGGGGVGKTNAPLPSLLLLLLLLLSNSVSFRLFVIPSSKDTVLVFPVINRHSPVFHSTPKCSEHSEHLGPLDWFLQLYCLLL